MELLNSNNSKPKTFWKRPEGLTGGLFLTGIVIGGGFLLYKFLPFIVNILQNALQATIFFVALAAILYVLLDPKFRNLIWYMYKSIMRWLTSLFVQIDPIGILESYVEHLYKNLREMDLHIGKLKGQMVKLKNIIGQNEREMEQSLRIAEEAKKQNNNDVVVINTRQYGRLEESNKRYKELLNKIELLYRVLSKMFKNSEYLIKDIENEVRIRKQERAAILASYGAMKRAMNIIKGDPDKKMMFDMAMEAIVDDISNKVGEMERFMEVSASFIDSIDIQNGVYEQKGLELLEKMEKEGISFILSDKKVDLLPKESEVVYLDNKEKEKEIEKNDNKANFNNYKNLFD